jgi:hypothetical protein
MTVGFPGHGFHDSHIYCRKVSQAIDFWFLLPYFCRVGNIRSSLKLLALFYLLLLRCDGNISVNANDFDCFFGLGFCYDVFIASLLLRN